MYAINGLNNQENVEQKQWHNKHTTIKRKRLRTQCDVLNAVHLQTEQWNIWKYNNLKTQNFLNST